MKNKKAFTEQKKNRFGAYGPVLAWNDPHVVNLSSEVSNADASASGVAASQGFGESLDQFIDQTITDAKLKKTLQEAKKL